MKPKIIAIVAATIDGKIAAHSRHQSNWTSAEDKIFMRKLLDKTDLIVVGNNTYKTAASPLSKRNCLVFTRLIKGIKKINEKLTYCNPAVSDVKYLLKEYNRIAILGGTQIYTYFLNKNLLDEIYLTVEPLVFGTGLNIFETEISKEIRLRLFRVKKLNTKGTILLHYKRK